MRSVTVRLASPTRFALALILIGTGWFGGYVWWLATRNWTPLDIPVSLSQGHIRTPEFRINVEATYLFRIAVRPEFDIEAGPCLAGFRCPSALDLSWSLSQGARVVLRAEKFPGGRILGGFHVPKGRYTLDLDVRQDGSRLNAGAPHLEVFEEGTVSANSRLREAQKLLCGSWLSGR